MKLLGFNKKQNDIFSLKVKGEYQRHTFDFSFLQSFILVN